MKIMFLSWHYKDPETFLEILRKQSPGRSGKWKEMEATTNMDEADFFIIHDGYRKPFPKERAIYFGQHPYDIIGKGITEGYRSFKKVECLAALPLSHYLNPGEWWISHDYDTLKAMKPPTKEKDLTCIVTYQDGVKSTYDDRIHFNEIFMPMYGKCDLYGRPENKFVNNGRLSPSYKGVLGKEQYNGYIGEHIPGKDILQKYRYSLEYDIGPTHNYICERFYDAMLLWTMPIYYGSVNTHEFVPENSFRYVNIEKHTAEEAQKVIDIVNSNFREKNITAMTEARNLLLDRWNTWAYTYEVVSNIDKYIKKWDIIKNDKDEEI